MSKDIHFGFICSSKRWAIFSMPTSRGMDISEWRGMLIQWNSKQQRKWTEIELPVSTQINLENETWVKRKQVARGYLQCHTFIYEKHNSNWLWYIHMQENIKHGPRFSILCPALPHCGLNWRDSLGLWFLVGFSQREGPAGSQKAEETQPCELVESLCWRPQLLLVPSPRCGNCSFPLPQFSHS